MTIALDLGAFAMRSLRRRENELIARRCRSMALSLGDNAARRRYLESSKASFLIAEDYLVLTGDAAVDAAIFFEMVPRELLPGGEIPTGDPVARQVISVVVDGLLPWSGHAQEICCFVQPGNVDPSADGDTGLGRRRQFVSRLIRLRGYEPLPLHPATALVLAELGPAGFTGIGLTLGASSCEMSVVHRGAQLAQGRVAHGGAWIDEQLARETKTWRRDALGQSVADVENARVRKEAVALAMSANADGRIVADLYRNLIAEVVEVLCETLNAHPQIPLLPQPLPIVCGGGPAQIAGFRELFHAGLGRREFPVALAGPRFIVDHASAVGRGCLIRAELEQLAAPQARSSRRHELAILK